MKLIALFLPFLLLLQQDKIECPQSDKIISFRGVYENSGEFVKRKVFLYSPSAEMFITYANATDQDPQSIQYYDRVKKQFMFAFQSDNGYMVKRSEGKMTVSYNPKYTSTTSQMLIAEKSCTEFISEKQGSVWFDTATELAVPSYLCGGYSFLIYGFQPRIGHLMELRSIKFDADVDKEMKDVLEIYFSKKD